MKKSKRILSLLLIFTMVFSFIPAVSFADNDAEKTRIYFEDQTVTVENEGDTFEINLMIGNNLGFELATFDVYYDKDLIECTKIVASENEIKGVSLKDSNPADCIVYVESDDGDVTENGVLATLVFKAKKSGTTEIYADFRKGDPDNFINYDMENVPTIFEKGTINLTIGGSEVAHTIAVTEPGAFSAAQGEQVIVDLSKIFNDDEHEIVFSIEGAENYSTSTKVKGNTLYFAEPKAGTYKLIINATCSEGATESAILVINVEEGDEGLDSQYGYNQTPADSVTVYITVSSDGIPILGNDKETTPLSHLEVEVPYFDLDNYGLQDYYRYEADEGGSYIGDKVIERPTAMHAFIYMIERYYMGVPENECGTGKHNPVGESGGYGVCNIFGDEAYTDSLDCLSYSGGAQSTYMVNFWGHDENLMYYRNHVYPLQAPGWGSTSDYILLSDGDTLDVAMFSNWNFYTYGAFLCFGDNKQPYEPTDEYVVKAGEQLEFAALKFGTQDVVNGGIDNFLAAEEYGILSFVCDENGKIIEEVNATEDKDYLFAYTFKKPGTYYLLGLDPSCGTEDAANAPATAKVVVKGGISEADEQAKADQEAADKIIEMINAIGEVEYTAESKAKIDTARAAYDALTDGQKAFVPTEVTAVLTAAEAAYAALEEEEIAKTLPRLKEGVAATSNGQVMVGEAYLLKDLQAGKIFETAEGSNISYTQCYYEKSADGGKTWSAKISFAEALFGATTIALTETAEGQYIYRFYASVDGKHFSKDTWTLTLDVVKEALWDVKFYVGQDYNYKTNSNVMPIIKVYPKDSTEAIEFTDSTFGHIDEETVYKSNSVVNGYNMFYARIPNGWYTYRAYGYNAETEKYDIDLGGMQIKIPMDKNVDGAAAGGTDIYLRLWSLYTTSKKADGTYFTADEYTAKMICPIMQCEATSGTPYKSGNYAYYPFMVYAGGNACLYNHYVYPTADGYMFNQAINATLAAGTSVQTKSMTISEAKKLTVTVPSSAKYALYFQYNNFNTSEQLPATEWKDNGNGTKTADFEVSKSNSNYTWRMTDTTGKNVTKGGWLSQLTTDTEITLTFDDGYTNKNSHDFSQLGTATIQRDEADLQVFVDPTGAIALGNETQRIRAYRMWQLINSDTANIMIEPDYTWTKLNGPAEISFVDDTAVITGDQIDSGNGYHNWADIKANGGTSIYTVHYDAIDLDTSNNKTHAGFYPATNPDRVAYVVVADELGDATAHVQFNGDFEANSRNDEWDYIYDTWYYLRSDEHPELTFTVKDAETVEYAYGVTSTDDMVSTLTAFNAATEADGAYSVSLNEFNSAANNYGGTVIIRMKDATGKYSYQLVKVAGIVANITNDSYPGEPIMPGCNVTITFDGLYRSINKISGIFNPTTFYARYTIDGKEVNGKLGQYQQMDKSSVTVTIPEDIDFKGKDVAEVMLTNGYVFGSMYSAANPFGAMYMMTDTGVGTNFNAVTVSFAFQKLSDITIPVAKMPTTAVTLTVKNAAGEIVNDYSANITKAGGISVSEAEGIYTLGFGDFNYEISAAGYIRERGSFTVSGEDNGVKNVEIMLRTADAATWDGTSKTEVTPVDGIYEIRTGAELAWFAQQVNAGAGASYSAKLMNNISLNYADWTPIGTSSSKPFKGTFDGNGYMITDLYINSTTANQGLFGYISAATIKNLGVRGNVTATANNVGGLIGYAAGKYVVENCFNGANVSGTQSVAGIVGAGVATGSVKNCYNIGNISATKFAGGIAAGSSTTAVPTATNCYNVGKVTCPTNAGGINIGAASKATNSYYLAGTVVTGTPAKAGTEKTAAELKEMAETLGEAFVADKYNINNGFPILAIDKRYAACVEAEAAAEKLAADQAAANAVIEQINAIGEVAYTDASKALINAARVAYDALTADQQLLVTNYETLTAAEAKYAELKKAAEDEAAQREADQAAADAVIAQINEIGEVTLESEAVIVKAREAYDALTDAQKTLVTNYETLTAAETKYAELKAAADEEAAKLAADKAAAADVDAKISAIGEVTLESVAVIAEARTAYDALTDAQKALVTNYETLTAAETKYAELKAAADEEAAKKAADQKAADAVITKIEQLKKMPVVANPNAPIGRMLEQTKAAYDALTDDQKALVTNYEDLVRIEKEYAEVYANTEAAVAVTNKINAIGEVTYTEESKGKIDTARAAYDALTADQQKLVTKYEVLTAAEAKYTELKAAAEKLAADTEAANAVVEQINAIGEVAYTDASKALIDAARAAYDALTDDQKAFVTEEQLTVLTAAEAKYTELKAAAEKLAADTEAANAVIEQINAIGEVAYTDASKALIDAARVAYDALTADQQLLVTNYETLTAAEAKYAELKAAAEKLAADTEAANAVIEQINAIGEVAYTDASKALIDAARAAYDALTADQQLLVTNYETLTAAEAKYAELKAAAEKLAADTEAANAVIEQINAIGEVAYTDASKALIDAARAAYDALTDAQKALVTNYETLTAAETKYAELKAAAEKLAADTEAANAVVEKINAIGEVAYTDASKALIDAARAAYDALTADQQLLVTNYETLTAAKAKYAELKAAAEKLAADTEAANAVVEKINAIGEVAYTDASKALIDAARAAYDALTADQQLLVTNYETLTAAKAKYAELKAAAEKLAADTEAANAVIEQINAIGEVAYTDASKALIDAARAAYAALTDDQKAFVTEEQLTVLTAAEAKYTELKAAAEAASRRPSGGSSAVKPEEPKAEVEIADEIVPLADLPTLEVTVTDVAGKWYESSATFVAEKGLMTGISETNFGGELTLNMAQVDAVIARLGGADQQSSWAEASAKYGKTEINRETTAVMLYNFAKEHGLVSADFAANGQMSEELAAFTDASSIEQANIDAMNWAISTGLFKGVGNSYLDIKGSLTRAQFATLLERYVTMAAK